MHDNRRDRATAATITEALRMKTAFGLDAARQFLWRQKVSLAIADRALAGRYDRRLLPS
jgi:hypothetical protein